jgi:hypothetical protein
MRWNRDLGELSPRGRAVLLGALAVCCFVPMLVLFGALSVTGAVFGGTAAVVVGAIGVVGWGAWMSHHLQHMTGHDHPPRTTVVSTTPDRIEGARR